MVNSFFNLSFWYKILPSRFLSSILIKPVFYAVLGGMKGITYTQVAQYCVLIFAYMVPAIFISLQLTGNPIPQLGFGGTLDDGTYLLDKVDGLLTELGFIAYTSGSKEMIDVFL